MQMATALTDYSPQEVVRISDFYQAWPKQKIFHEMSAKNRLQIGGFGSAKSRALLMEAVVYCIEYPGVNVGLVRKTMPDLKRTVIDKFEADIPKSTYERGSQEKGQFNKSDHIVWWPPVYVDKETGEARSEGDPRGVWRQSKLYFIACESERDVGKYLSTEFAFLGFEELGEFPFTIYDALVNRNRTTIPNCRPTTGAATNPMGIGWSWIKKIYIEKKPAYGMDPDLYDPDDYDFIHSTVEDNPILFADKEYVRGLERSPLRDRIRWGKLDVTTGQYFDNWDITRHYRSASDFIFEPWQPVWVGWDWGFGHFACIVFMTKAILKPRWEGAQPKIVNVAVREIYLKEETAEVQAEALVKSIPRAKDKDGDDAGYAEQIESIHFSWERFARKGTGPNPNRSIADDANEVLQAAGLPTVTRSNTDRVAGWTKIYKMLDGDEFFVIKQEGTHRGCPQLAEAIPLLVRGDGTTVGQDIEDVVKPPGVSLIDDLGDALRYAVAGVLLDAEEKPEDLKKKEQMLAIKDPMRRFAEMYKDWNKEQAALRRGPKQVNVPSWVNRVRPQ